MRLSLASALFLLLVGCASHSSSDPTGGAGEAGGDDSGTASPGTGSGGGGNIGFGGAQDVGDFQSILDRGQIPGPDTFDANGFFNEHYNAPAAASCGALLCAVPGLAVGHDWVTGQHQATLQIAIQSTVDPSIYKRLPMNLVVVIDHSGSMAEDGRLTKVQAGLHTMIDNLQDGDQLAIVQFDDTVQTIAPLAALDRTSLHTIVDGLAPGGGTDIFAGLQQGFALLGDTPASERQNRVILLSDGNATSGDTSTADIETMAQQRVALGIGLTTIGVGDDFDIDLMRGLAEQGAGNFYFLEDADDATSVFTEELDYFMQPIALDIQVAATAGPGYQLGAAVGTSLWQTATDGTNGTMTIPAVFVANRTSQTTMGRRGGGSMLFIPLTSITGNNGQVANINLSFRTPGSAERVTQTVSLNYANDPTQTPDMPYLSSPDMGPRYAMYNMYLGIHEATMSTSPSCATQILQALRTNATTWNTTNNNTDITADLALVDEYLGNLSEQPQSTGDNGYPGDLDDGDGSSVAACVADAQPVPPPQPVDSPPPVYGDDEACCSTGGFALGCSAGGAAGGLPVMLGALGAIGLRRRKRANRA